MMQLGLSEQETSLLRNDVKGIIEGRPHDIALKRGSEILPVQRFRCERTRFRLVEWENPRSKSMGQEMREAIFILGEVDLDIKRGDEFFFEGNLYRVEVVDPNQQISINARADLAQ